MNDSITRNYLRDKILSEIPMTKKMAKILVDEFFNQLVAQLMVEDEILLSGFGKFTAHYKNARPGRNPKTGEEVPISPRRIITFKSSPALKNSILEKIK